MKILPSASLEYHEINHAEKKAFIFFGAVIEDARVEKYYLFKDSQKKNPNFIRRITLHEGRAIWKKQTSEPALLPLNSERVIYLFRNIFVECNKPTEDLYVVRGVVLEREEREEKRIDRLRKKGSSS